MNNTVIKPKAPESSDWVKIDDYPMDGYDAVRWMHIQKQLVVISGVEVPEPEKGPEYHVSVSKMGQRCHSEEAAWAMEQFDMFGAEEDNHVAYGKVRNFWKPVAEKLIGMECPCKDEETAIKEDKGDYVWREENSR